MSAARARLIRMALIDALTVPLDPTSAATLAENGLEYRRVLTDTDAFAPFLQAVNRGFLGEEAAGHGVRRGDGCPPHGGDLRSRLG